MQNANIIRTSIAYIEQNLKNDITAEELARMAGYSVWHYQRMFAQVVGVPLAAYINRRRLDCALAEIGAKRKAVDAAMEYGSIATPDFTRRFCGCMVVLPKSICLFTGHINQYWRFYLCLQKQN